jgi:hypothetical protein
MKMEYNPIERFSLCCLALAGFAILNSVFIYALFFEQSTIAEALKNPISLAFIIESFLLMAALAYLLNKWSVSKLHWGWFLLLSLLGSMAFALPLVLLWPFGRDASAPVSKSLP